MPLLEINQTHYISASVRLDESTRTVEQPRPCGSTRPCSERPLLPGSIAPDRAPPLTRGPAPSAPDQGSSEDTVSSEVVCVPSLERG